MSKEYERGVLRRVDLDPNPLVQLRGWIEEARQCEIEEPAAATLATASLEGIPSTRTVLIKSILEEGVVFYTHYESRKGREIEANPAVSLTFYWRELERQVIIDGLASYLSQEESQAYFGSRLRQSQIGAWASHQGNPVGSREELERAYQLMEEKYGGEEVPMPPHWGGYLIVPLRIEFWQGRAARLHDRISYRMDDEGWHRERLSP